MFEAFVPESDVKRLKIGDIAFCRLDSNPTTVIRCQVQRISPDPIDSIPNLLIGDSMLIAIRDASGAIRPDVPHYRVTLKTNEKLPHAIHGNLAMVSFEVSSRTLWDQVSSYLLQQWRTPIRSP